MKTIVIVGGTRDAAHNRLKRIAKDDGIVRRDFYDEATLDGHRIMAFGGELENVCFLVALGFSVAEIITVEWDDISDGMQKRITLVRSANKT